MKNFLVLLILLLTLPCSGQKLISLSKVIKIEDAIGITDGYIKVMLPKDIPHRQTLVDIQFSHKPDKTLVEDNLNFLSWDIVKFHIGDSLKIDFTFLLDRYDLSMAKKNKNDFFDTLDLKKYLQHELHFQKDNKKIRKKAESLIANTEVKTVENIYDFVIDHLEYKRFFDQDRGSRKALSQGQGDCTEYSELMIALCRSNNIPARIVSGNTIGGNGYVGRHNWVEVFLKELGWVPFDPTFADSENSATEFDKMQNVYVYFSNTRHVSRISWRWYGQFIEVKTYLSWRDPQRRDFIRGTKLYLNNQNTEALQVLDSLVTLTPKNCQYQMFRGVIHARLGNFDTGLEAFQIALQNANSNYAEQQTYYSFANYFALKGDSDAAISYLKKSIEMGFSNFDHMKKDSDLESLFELQEFQELLK